MRVTTKGLYAIEVLCFLASQKLGKSVSISEIEEKTSIPYDYAEKILLRLKRAGMVESRRGNAGGYIATAHADALTLADIFKAVGEEIAPWPKMPRQKKNRPLICPIHPVWQKLYREIDGFFRKTTLKDFLR